MDSSTGPVLPPAVRFTTIVADGNAHVATPFWVKVNFTRTTPRLTLKTLVPWSIAYLAIAARTRNTQPTAPKTKLTIQNLRLLVSAEIAAMAIAI